MERLTSLKLEFSAEDIHEEFDDGVHRCEGIGEQEETDHDWLFAVKTEGFIQRSVINER